MSYRENPQTARDLDRVLEHHEVLDRMKDIGDRVADRARELAPKDTGEGAASIHAEFARDPLLGLHVRVSWEKGQFLGLHELGTEKHPPTPFLRPAADEFL